MTPHIGTPTSRIDGRAKVTGAAKYAAEYNRPGLALGPGLAYGYLVTSDVAKGRVTQIDTDAARQVPGVIDVLTHQNRPHMADADSAYKDDVAPEGSPFRPLYDDRIRFSGQPIALVVAEEWETARFAASLVRVDYDEEAHVTDLHSQQGRAVALGAPASPAEAPFFPPKPRGSAEAAFAAAAVRHEGEYYVPIEYHNPMEPYASTASHASHGGTGLAEGPAHPRADESARAGHHDGLGRGHRAAIALRNLHGSRLCRAR